jgi:hypothetical protein
LRITSRILFRARTGETAKVVRAIVICVPLPHLAGEKPLIVGAPVPDAMSKEVLDATEDTEALTLIAPDVAPAGTVTVSCV